MGKSGHNPRAGGGGLAAAGHVLRVQHGGQGLVNLTKRHLSLLKFTGDIEDIHVLAALFTQ